MGWSQGGGLDGSAGNPGFLNGNLSCVGAGCPRASLSWGCLRHALDGSLGCMGCVCAYKPRTGVNPAPVLPTMTCKGKGLLKMNQSPPPLCPFFTQTFPQTSPHRFTCSPLPQTPRPAPLILMANPLPSSPDSHRGRQSHQGGVGDLPAAGAAPPALPAPPLQAGAGKYGSCPSFPLLIPASNSDFHPSCS